MTRGFKGRKVGRVPIRPGDSDIPMSPGSRSGPEKGSELFVANCAGNNSSDPLSAHEQNPYESPRTECRAAREGNPTRNLFRDINFLLFIVWIVVFITFADQVSVDARVVRFDLPRWLCFAIGSVPVLLFLLSIAVLRIRAGNRSRISLVRAIGAIPVPVRTISFIVILVAFSLLLHYSSNLILGRTDIDRWFGR